jgi:hypothetical protein
MASGPAAARLATLILGRAAGQPLAARSGLLGSGARFGAGGSVFRAFSAEAAPAAAAAPKGPSGSGAKMVRAR